MSAIEKNAYAHDPQGDEYLDLVNEHDEVIGRKLRSQIYEEKLSNFRVVNAFIKNSEGLLWIPQRSSTKKIFPGALDFSMGGHVKSGESYDDAFIREMDEELGFHPEKDRYRLLEKLLPGENGVAAFMHVYEIDADVAPPYNPEEIQSGRWLSPRELLEIISRGMPTKEPDLRIAVEMFYKGALT